MTNDSGSSPDVAALLDELHTEFDVDESQIRLDWMLIARHPRRVREAIERHRKRLDEDPFGYLLSRFDPDSDDERRVRRLAAEYLGLRVEGPESRIPDEQIALVDSTTTGLGLLYNGLRVGHDQHILTTPHAFYSTLTALKMRWEREGTRFRTVRLFDDSARVTKQEILANLDVAINRKTRVLALTWVHSNTGVKLPIPEIAARVRKVNRTRAHNERLLLCVDGVHGFGVEDAAFDDLGCDFFVAGCHKWIFGPRGTGIICGKKDAWTHLLPTIPTLSPRGAPGLENSPGGVLAYEHRWALADAFELHLSIGKRVIRDRTHELAALLKEGLRETPRVSVVTPPSSSLSAGIVCCSIAGVASSDLWTTVVKPLREHHAVLASLSSSDAAGKSYLRFSPSAINTDDEIHQAVKALRELISMW